MAAKNKGGRPVFAPTDKQRETVKNMTALGARQDDICILLDIDEKTLRKHFRRELDTGLIQANMAVGATLFKMATSGQVPSATFFWMKTRAGYKETNVHEHTGKDGAPIEYKKIQDMTDDELLAIAAGGGAGTSD